VLVVPSPKFQLQEVALVELSVKVAIAGELDEDRVGVNPAVGMAVNVAVVAMSSVAVKVQGAVPAQSPPDQPVKPEPLSGVAVNEIEEPLWNEEAHVIPQEIPAGELVTVPVPEPDLATVIVGSIPTPFSAIFTVGFAGSLVGTIR